MEGKTPHEIYKKLIWPKIGPFFSRISKFYRFLRPARTPFWEKYRFFRIYREISQFFYVFAFRSGQGYPIQKHQILGRFYAIYMVFCGKTLKNRKKRVLEAILRDFRVF